ncbi:MAG: hypothetical protein ACJ8EF_23035 [Bradyrhizobium sp.]
MTVTLELDQDAAIVIFELLSKHDENGGASLALSRADECALDQLLASLERKLVEPFTANYGETDERARTALLQRFGGR